MRGVLVAMHVVRNRQTLVEIGRLTMVQPAFFRVSAPFRSPRYNASLHTCPLLPYIRELPRRRS
jgi:hypothetical protein